MLVLVITGTSVVVVVVVVVVRLARNKLKLAKNAFGKVGIIAVVGVLTDTLLGVLGAASLGAADIAAAAIVDTLTVGWKVVRAIVTVSSPLLVISVTQGDCVLVVGSFEA